MANEEQLEMLKSGVRAWNDWRTTSLGTSAELSSADLGGAYLIEANLHRANLAGANLSGADLPGADLSDANLSDANLSDANLHRADLGGADLGKADLRGANLFWVDLRGANLRGANLSRADLRGADLRKTNLHDANLSGVDLRRGADHRRADLMWADLTAANLRGAGLRDAALHNANLRGANLSEADLDGAFLNGANLTDANLRGANLSGANLIEANLAKVKISNTILTNVDLSVFVNVPISHRGPSTIDHRSIARSLHCENLLPFLVETGMHHVVATYLIDSIKSLDPNGLFNLMHSTFISYGGPDEAFATKLQRALQSNGVTTFLFKKDAVMGQHLSDVMRSGINEHDRTVLICSEASLNRKGVLNEIRLAINREAEEGGMSLLIPIAVDGYVFDKWAPDDKNLQKAVLQRVIGDFQGADTDQSKFDQGIARLLEALKVSP